MCATCGCMGSMIRNRKQVKADRAESGSHAKLVAAMGGTTPTKSNVTEIPAGSKEIKNGN